MKSFLRSLAMKLPLARMEQLYAHALHGHVFAHRLQHAPTMSSRAQIWEDVANRVGKQTKILYLELGVFAGESLRSWTQLNQNPASRFVGFDTFEGLPESWAGLPQGHFSTEGNLPSIDDSRVSFEKGLFQDTLASSLRSFKFDEYEQIVVHFDADLFSSTIFSFSKILQHSSEFYAIFDEFSGDEARAFYAMERAYALETKWFAQTVERDRPVQASCHIKSNALR